MLSLKMGHSCLIGCFRVLRVPCVCMCMSVTSTLTRTHILQRRLCACTHACKHAACSCSVRLYCLGISRSSRASRFCGVRSNPRPPERRSNQMCGSAAHDGPAPCACTRPVSPQAIPSTIHATHNPPLLLLRRRCGDVCLPGGTLCPGAAARPLPRCECQSQQRRCLHSQSCQPQQ